MENYVMKNIDLSDITMQNLTETEKEHLILKCKDASSKEEAEKIASSFKADAASDLLMGEAVVYGPLENTNS
jgi:hypothetical protein